MQKAVLPAQHLDTLIQNLLADGYEVIGPTVADNAIIYDAIESADNLPIGYTDRQTPGHYRILFDDNDNKNYFSYTIGANSWKKFLNPAKKLLWRAEWCQNQLVFIPNKIESPPLAFIGVRACELNAIYIQDKVFLNGDYQDPQYCSRRQNLFIVGVNCTRTSDNCFCESVASGPAITRSCDITLTEINDGQEHYFLTTFGSEEGEKHLAQLPISMASREQLKLEDTKLNNIKVHLQKSARHFDLQDTQQLLEENLESPLWDDIADRCLSCANCTMACPTCFCSAVEDTTDLTGEHAERWQRWDSCFNNDFSYIHGGAIRKSRRSRYRQWMTHKFDHWFDQFEQAGCVGCGRCITWCPVAIDITEQIKLFQQGTST